MASGQDNGQYSDRDALMSLHGKLGRMEGALGGLRDAIDHIGETIKDHNDRTERRLNEHSLNIRKVENRQYWFSGAAAGIGAIIGVVLKAVGLYH